MNIPIVLTVHASERFSSKKDGKSYVKITCTGAGIGLFQFIVSEDKIPDHLEGKTLKARFKLYVGRDFSVKFGFGGVEGYTE